MVLVRDESVANRILELVPWAVMKQNLSVKIWTENLAMEEVPMHLVLFWVQMKKIPLSLCSEENISKLVNKCGDLIEVEALSKARGFLRLRIMVDTSNPLALGCWVTREASKESWVEFQYETLQDFFFKCGTIGHTSLECPATDYNTDVTGYGEWTRTRRIIKDPEDQRRTNIAQGRRRQVRTNRVRGGPAQVSRVINILDVVENVADDDGRRNIIGVSTTNLMNLSSYVTNQHPGIREVESSSVPNSSFQTEG